MSQTMEIRVPDLGRFSDVPVIEVLVKPGDILSAEDALVTLESDKATMDVPSPLGGKIVEVCVAVGDRLSSGSLLARMAVEKTSDVSAAPPSTPLPASSSSGGAVSPPASPSAAPLPSAGASAAAKASGEGEAAYASPSVRQLARELGIDLQQVVPSGPKGRILKEDISACARHLLQKETPLAGSAPAASSVPAASGIPSQPCSSSAFSEVGPVDIRPLSRIQKISGKHLMHCWTTIPSVTYCEEADVTELEAFRQAVNKEHERLDPPLKITLLAFVIKACEIALRKFPEFNSSLEGDHLVLKKYFNIAFAADTPQGLVVPVIKNVDTKTVAALALETAALSQKARAGKLLPEEMRDACFTVSSLGGIGTTHFSPIVNAPEVAILGVGRLITKPLWNGSEFTPRLVLPLSLSADHRVIDGALGARFGVFLARLLSDMRRALI